MSGDEYKPVAKETSLTTKQGNLLLVFYLQNTTAAFHQQLVAVTHNKLGNNEIMAFYLQVKLQQV